MQSIVIQDRASGTMRIYNPRYPAQRSFFEQKRTERIMEAMREIEHMGNVNIFLFKRGRLRKIGERKF